ncbi:MAG: hypothetical protein JOS17DRAFT_775238 [Linnemannia elongata]|nr:MAG: hypothetical protein JOS17DRAFT_775238 [Linnemannia elongata]
MQVNINQTNLLPRRGWSCPLDLNRTLNPEKSIDMQGPLRLYQSSRLERTVEFITKDLGFIVDHKAPCAALDSSLDVEDILINKDFVVIKGYCASTRKRVVTFRKPLFVYTKCSALKNFQLKFIDTSSKVGHGRFLTREKCQQFQGTLERDL